MIEYETYEPHEWEDDELISEERVNELENGLGEASRAIAELIEKGLPIVVYHIGENAYWDAAGQNRVTQAEAQEIVARFDDGAQVYVRRPGQTDDSYRAVGRRLREGNGQREYGLFYLLASSTNTPTMMLLDLYYFAASPELP